MPKPANEEFWLPLLRLTLEMFDDAEARHGPIPYTLGGGSMLARRYRHRVSRDLDVFVTDTRILNLLSPRNNELTGELFPDYQESGNALKFIIGMQEIDVIVGRTLIAKPYRHRRIAGRSLAVEEPAEIMAKKLYYRGRELTHRDVFDMAVVAGREPGQLAVLATLLPPQALDDIARRLDELEPAYRTVGRQRIDLLPDGAPYFEDAVGSVRRVLSEWRRRR